MCVESLSIRFAGYPDLSGTYRINPDGTISIPGIGRVPVRGHDAIALEKLLSRKLTDVGGRESFASVEVATYLPILIVGHVNTSGQRPWHPGMTVQQAVAMSGGISTQLQNAIADQQRVLTTLARLRAELQDKADIETPPQLVNLVGRAAADALIEAQRPLFFNRRRSLENQLDTLERGRVLASQELEGLKAQNEKIAEQLRLRREYRSKVQALESKGLMRADMSMESDLRISELEEKGTNIIVAVARVQGTLAGLQREAMMLKQTTQAAIYEEISRLQTDSDRLAVAIDAARITHGSAYSGSRSDGGSSEPLTIGYKIVRLETPNRRTVQANESTLLKPGDTLVVWQGRE